MWKPNDETIVLQHFYQDFINPSLFIVPNLLNQSNSDDLFKSDWKNYKLVSNILVLPFGRAKFLFLVNHSLTEIAHHRSFKSQFHKRFNKTKANAFIFLRIYTISSFKKLGVASFLDSISGYKYNKTLPCMRLSLQCTNIGIGIN